MSPRRIQMLRQRRCTRRFTIYKYLPTPYYGRVRRRSDMPKRRKNVILVCLVLLTSIGVLCIAIVTLMLMGRPLSSTTKAMTPQELLVSSDMQQRFSVLSKASTDYCSNIGNRPAIYADMANMA